MTSRRREHRWLLVFHQIPRTPGYLRVAVWRRLNRLGAVSVRNGVYALPRDSVSLKKLKRVVTEAKAVGVVAFLCKAEFIEDTTSEALVQRFREERDADYEALSAAVRDTGAAISRRGGVRPPERKLVARVTRLKTRYAEIESIDFFSAPGRKTSKALLTSLEQQLRATRKGAGKRKAGDDQLRRW